MRPSVKERARAFVAKARPAIAGQNGHDATFAVACGLVVGFGLTDADTWELLQQYNVASCQPSWSEKELRRKLTEARKQAERDPSAVGKLAEQDAPNYTGPRLPTNSGKPAAPAKPAQGGQPTDGDAARTVRTALFKVFPAGAGRSCAPSRTLRTLQTYSKPYGEKEKVSGMDWSEEAPSEVSEPRTARTAPVESVQQPAQKPKHVRQVVSVTEPVDVTAVYRNGDVYKKTWKQKEFQRIGNLNDARRG